MAGPKTSAPNPQCPFEDVAEQVGLTVSPISAPEKKYILESMRGGVGLVCDNGGDLDITTVTGRRHREGVHD